MYVLQKSCVGFFIAMGAMTFISLCHGHDQEPMSCRSLALERIKCQGYLITMLKDTHDVLTKLEKSFVLGKKIKISYRDFDVYHCVFCAVN